MLPYHPHQEGVGEGTTARGLDRCKLPGGQGVTGLNWLREHSLPQESEDKQEKGNNRDSYCVASLPGDVSRVRSPQIGQEPERWVGPASPTKGPSPLFNSCRNWNDLAGLHLLLTKILQACHTPQPAPPVLTHLPKLLKILLHVFHRGVY